MRNGFVTGLCGLAFFAGGVVVNGAWPTTAELVAKGDVTVTQIAKEGRAWTTQIDMRQGSVVSVERISRGDEGKWRFSIDGASHLDLGEIVQKKGIWYVNQRGRKEKYRPFEAVMDAPSMYLWLKQSELRVLAAMPRGALALGEEGGKLVAREPLPPATKEQLTSVLAQANAMMAKDPVANAKYAPVMKAIEDLVLHGIRYEIDPESGVITQISNAKMEITVRGLRSLTKADETQLDVADDGYEDRTGPIAADMNDVTMIWHCSYWRPGRPLPDMDVMLLNVKTGAERRLPLTGADAMPGCFSGDRRTAWVSGLDLTDGRMRPVSVNIKTAVNTLVAGKEGETGSTVGIARSWDGKYLCFSHKDFSKEKILNVEVVVKNLATGEEKTVGPSADYGPVTWGAGDVIILVRRDAVDLNDPVAANKVAPAKICSMDLTGKVTELVAGHQAVVVDSGKTILFQEDKVWSRCDLDGKNVAKIGDGLAKCNFATASPDGSRVLMMDYGEPEKGPRPVVVDWKTGTMEKVPVGEGIWAMPAWR